MFIGYNLTRCASILGVAKLINLLRECGFYFLNLEKHLFLSSFNQLLFYKMKIAIWEMRIFYALKTDLIALIEYIYYQKTGFCTDSRCQ